MIAANMTHEVRDALRYLGGIKSIEVLVLRVDSNTRFLTIDLKAKRGTNGYLGLGSVVTEVARIGKWTLGSARVLSKSTLRLNFDFNRSA